MHKVIKAIITDDEPIVAGDIVVNLLDLKEIAIANEVPNNNELLKFGTGITFKKNNPAHYKIGKLILVDNKEK